MILQALKEYYDRKAADPDSGIAPEGFENKEIPFVIVLDSEGNLVQIEDTRSQVGKQLRAKSFLVPQGEKRASGIKANLFWDNVEYMLGVCVKGRAERVVEQHTAFVSRIKSLNLETDEGIESILFFVEKLASGYRETIQLPDEVRESNPFMSFRLISDTHLICQRPAVLDRVMASEVTGEFGVCLITGDSAPLANLQPAIKGIRGANTTGANIVSFNLSAFNSFGKTQGANSPISEKASFAYTTALNYLLRKESPQKLTVGDATVIFWSAKQTELETNFSLLFDEPPKEDPDRLTNAVKSLYRSLDTGALAGEIADTRFFVLGLSPNAARVSVRFWHTGTVAEFSHRIAQYFLDLDIVHAPHQRESLSIWFLLKSIAALQKSENIPPNLAGDWMRSILSGLPYPETLLHAAIRRIRAERNVSYAQAAIVKASLNNKIRFYRQPEKEITVSLDLTNISPGYRLGRLFATLEKIQEEAAPGINATIRDRYYSAASGTPASVMPILMRLKNHHLGKLEKGRTIWFERLLAEVLAEVSDFPNQLNLQEQGRFAIGYYHQRQAFFTKSQTTAQTTAQGA
jgi:CRISPR-associated protein Csd1